MSEFKIQTCEKIFLKITIFIEIQKISKNILKSTILTFQKRREFIFSAENVHIEINNIF